MPSKRFCPWLFALGVVFAAAPVSADVCVKDDIGRTVCLKAPAERIATLSPHSLELVSYAGASEKIIAKTRFSPSVPGTESARTVGDYRRIDNELLATLSPDLIVVWGGGRLPGVMTGVSVPNVPVYVSNPKSLKDIASSVRRLGELAGVKGQADRKAAAFEKRVADLKSRYAGQKRLSVFYEVSVRPLFTLETDHVGREAVALCGGDVIYGKAANMSREEVIRTDPDVIVVSAPFNQSFALWQRFPAMKAVANKRIYSLTEGEIERPSPALIDGAEKICRILDQVRKKTSGQ